jgi:hypothetical protein
MKFDFYFNGKNESGSGMLEAIENKDGSFTAISGFVRTLDNDAAEPLQAFENIYGKMSLDDIASLEKISLEETKGSEYLSLFVNPKGSEASYSPSGYFFYDNVLYPSSGDLLLGNPGLLFTAASGKELNLFTNGPSSYVDYQNDGFNIPTSFHLIALSDYAPAVPHAELPDSSVATVPEPSSLALLGLGFLNFFLFRRMSAKRKWKRFPFFWIVSTARFDDPVNEQRLVEYRAAKQSLSSTLKSFGVPESADVNSVLSYAQSVEEHDRKGNRPSAEAMAIFRENLRLLDAKWKAYKNTSLK